MASGSSSEDDAEDTRDSVINKRTERLGFRPQSEIFCNKLLPYADVLDDESQAFLIEVKDGLAKAVAMREIKPTVGVYMNRLCA